MNPVLGQEMAAARMSDTLRRMERNSVAKQARSAKRRQAKQTPDPQGRFIPALRLGRAVLRLRSKPVQPVGC